MRGYTTEGFAGYVTLQFSISLKIRDLIESLEPNNTDVGTLDNHETCCSVSSAHESSNNENGQVCNTVLSLDELIASSGRRQLQPLETVRVFAGKRQVHPKIDDIISALPPMSPRTIEIPTSEVWEIAKRFDLDDEDIVIFDFQVLEREDTPKCVSSLDNLVSSRELTLNALSEVIVSQKGYLTVRKTFDMMKANEISEEYQLVQALLVHCLEGKHKPEETSAILESSRAYCEHIRSHVSCALASGSIASIVETAKSKDIAHLFVIDDCNISESPFLVELEEYVASQSGALRLERHFVEEGNVDCLRFDIVSTDVTSHMHLYFLGNWTDNSHPLIKRWQFFQKHSLNPMLTSLKSLLLDQEERYGIVERRSLTEYSLFVSSVRSMEREDISSSNTWNETMTMLPLGSCNRVGTLSLIISGIRLSDSTCINLCKALTAATFHCPQLLPSQSQYKFVYKAVCQHMIDSLENTTNSTA